LCQEIDGLDIWASEINEKTLELLRLYLKNAEKVWFLSQVTTKWSAAQSEHEQQILILALINLVYLNSAEYFDKYGDLKTVREIGQLMIYELNNIMQYEIESLINSFIRQNKQIVINLIDQFGKLVNQRKDLILENNAEIMPNNPNTSKRIYNSTIFEYIASCVRNSAKSLFSISRNIYLLILTIIEKDTANYLDIFDIEGIIKLQTEYAYHYEMTCLSAFNNYWVFTRLVDKLKIGEYEQIENVQDLEANLTVSTLVSLNYANKFIGNLEKNITEIDISIYKNILIQILSEYEIWLPLKEHNSLPPVMNLLSHYKEFDTLRNLIKLIKEKSAIFNFMSLYCNAELHNLQEMQKNIMEASSFYRLPAQLDTNISSVTNLVIHLGISSNLELSHVLRFKNPELNYYNLCLEIFKNIDPDSKLLLLNSILWTYNESNNKSEFDIFWNLLSDIYIDKKLYIKSYQSITNIKNKEMLRKILSKFIESIIIDRQLDLIRSQIPIPGLKSEILKHLRKRTKEQIGDYEQLLRCNIVSHIGTEFEQNSISQTINYATLLYSFYISDLNFLAAAEIMISQHLAILAYSKNNSLSLENLYSLLILQKKSLLLAINAFCLSQDENAKIQIVEDLPEKKKRNSLESVFFK